MAITLSFSTTTGVVSSSLIGTATFSSVPCGDAHNDKIVIFGVTAENPTNFTGATFNGVSATKVVQAISSATPFNIAAIFTLRHTSSTVTVVVTSTSTAASNHMGTTWSMIGAESTTSITQSTGTAGSGTTCQITGPTIPTGGVCVYVFSNATAGTAVAWTRATERSDASATSYRHSTADSSTAGSTTHIADGATAQQCLVAAAFTPQPEIRPTAPEYPRAFLLPDKMVSN